MTFHTRRALAAIAAGCFMMHASSAVAGDLLTNDQFDERYSGGAVSALNFKIEGGYIATDFADGGEFDAANGEYIQGAVSIPLGGPVSGQFGLQIDAGYLQSNVDGASGFEDFDISGHGIGGHLFWRDPSIGLLGIYGHQSEYEFANGPNDKVKNLRIGMEAEAYLGSFTVKGFVGKDRLDWNFVTNTEDFLTASGELDFYINDNLMVFAGVEHAFEETTGKAGFEAMFDTGSISSALFAEAKLGEDSQTVMAGLRVYFGPQGKSLKARHREDDPEIDLFGNLAAIGSCMNGALDLDYAVVGKSNGKVSGIFPVGSGMPSFPVMGPGEKVKLDGCSSKGMVPMTISN